MRRIVRYRNRKLYEPAERRFVTIGDLARSVASGTPVEVRSADTNEDITARILSRAMASGSGTHTPSTDALARILQAGTTAADAVAEVVEKVAGKSAAENVRRAAAPDKFAETLAPLARRLDTARIDVERIVGNLVGRGRLTWEEGARLREDVGAVFGESLAEILARFRDLASRLGPNASPEMAKEIGELKSRIDQLEALASASFGSRAASRPPSDRKAARTERTARAVYPPRPTQPRRTERRK